VEVLLEPFAARGRHREALRAALALALGFEAWRVLADQGGLDDAEAVEVAGRLALAA
jgi:hypothetical protein